MKNRIKWVDYFKAITMILVVVGHATGLFNIYIYQFHVAAFFFISGYTSKLNQKKFFNVLYDKFMTLIVPYTFLGGIGVVGIYLLNKIGKLGSVSSITEVEGINVMLSSMYAYLRCDWLGASWFLLALFGGIVIQCIIMQLCKNKIGWKYCVISTGLVAVAYYWKKIGSCPIPVRNFTLYAFVQYYILWGILASELTSKYKKKLQHYDKWLPIVGFILSTIMLYINGKVLGWKMALDCLEVNNVFIDTYLVVNGVIFVWSLARILENIKIALFGKTLCLIGRNTLGILFIHFCAFKICTFILVVIGKANLGDIAPLCPPAYLSNSYWWLYTIIAIGVSVIIWEIAKKIPVVNFLLGMDKEKNDRIYEKLS